jgi:hypothetical protein
MSTIYATLVMFWPGDEIDFEQRGLWRVVSDELVVNLLFSDRVQQYV